MVDAPRIVSRVGAELRIFPDAAHLAAAAADALLAAAPRQLVLAGGSTPEALYRELAARGTNGLEHGSVWFGDERCVPPSDPASNYRMAARAWLDRAEGLHVHRIMAELPPHEAADAYERALRAAFPGAAVPGFDLVLLGIGDDGHTASLFPDTAALDERSRWVVANNVPKLGTWRITMTFGALSSARAVWITVSGEGKAAIVGEIFGNEATLYPVQRVRPEGGTVWWLDEAAAAQLG
jgi:6-phosphogluconolactonase